MSENQKYSSIDVSIIIVNYNTKDMTVNCIKSIIENTVDLQYEIILVDNASNDGSSDEISWMFKEVIVVRNNINIGFGAANNKALKIARGKYVFYLNSDTILMNNAVKYFFEFWEGNNIYNIGCLGCRLINEDGIYIHSWGKFPTPFKVLKSLLHCWLLPSVNKTKKGKKVENNIGEQVINGYITGAALFLKNDENATFDERFFMYCEETDLQWNNFYKKNKKIIMIHKPVIIHLEGKSDKTEKRFKYDFGRLSSRYYWISSLRYLRKNYPEEKLFIYIIKKTLKFIWNSRRYREYCSNEIIQLKKI